MHETACKLIYLICFIIASLSLQANRVDAKRDSLHAILTQKTEAPLKEKADIYVELIDILKHTDLDLGMEVANSAYEQASKDNEKKIANLFAIKRGELERILGQYDSARIHVQKAIDFARLNSDSEQLAQASLIMSKIFLDLSMYDACYKALMDSKKLFVKIKDVKGERQTHNVEGCILLYEEKYEEAAQFFLKTAREDSILDFNDLAAVGLLNLALSYVQMGEIEKAKAYYKKALEITEKEGLAWLEVAAYMNLALLYSENKDAEEALQAIDRAISVVVLVKNQRQYCQVIFSKGTIYKQKGDYPEALKYLHQSLELAQKYDFTELALSAVSDISYIYQQMRDFEKSNEYLNLKVAYTKSLISKQNINNLVALRFEYAAQQKEQEDLHKERLKNLWFALIAGILVLISIVLWTILTRKRLQLRNAALKQESLEKEVEHKKKEIFTKIMYLRKKNEAISTVAQKLMDAKPVFKPENQEIIVRIVKELLDYGKDDSWKEFELRFEEVHLDFFKKLNELFPDLTRNEKRLCAYLRLNISTKDIASLLHISVDGVESARYRLRKKLNINSRDVDIVDFLENL